MGAGEITAICATLTTIALGFGGGLWQAGRALCEFAKPYIVGFFESHRKLVDTLSETQEQQCRTQREHSEALGRIEKKLSDPKFVCPHREA